MSEVLFAVFQPSTHESPNPWANYASCMAEANSIKEELDTAHGGDWTTVYEYHGGEQEPNGTKCCVAYEHPEDLAFATIPAEAWTLTELQIASDLGWFQPAGLKADEPQAAVVEGETVLGKRLRKTRKKATPKR